MLVVGSMREMSGWKGRRTTGVWVFGGEVDGGVEVGYLVCERGLAEHLGFYCVDKGADLCCALVGVYGRDEADVGREGVQW